MKKIAENILAVTALILVFVLLALLYAPKDREVVQSSTVDRQDVSNIEITDLRSRMPQSFVAAEARSGAWEKVRKLHLIREPACAWCGGKTDLQVHHIYPFALNPLLHGSTESGGELDDGKDGTGRDGNLITLCMIPKNVAKNKDEADHHERYGHNGYFRGGENLNVREDCIKHFAEIHKLE